MSGMAAIEQLKKVRVWAFLMMSGAIGGWLVDFAMIVSTDDWWERWSVLHALLLYTAIGLLGWRFWTFAKDDAGQESSASQPAG